MNVEYNKKRGLSMLMNTIGEHLNSNPANSNLLEKLIAHFADRVCVMVADEDIQELMKTDGEYYAASRLAQACIQAVSSRFVDQDNWEALLQSTVELYHEAKAFNANQPAKPKSDQEIAADLALNEELTNNQQTEDIEIEVEDEFGNIHTQTIQGEVFSMTQFADREDLTVEGKRAIGMLPSTFNPDTDDEEANINRAITNLPEALIVQGEDGYPKILCPQCKGDQIYPDGGYNEFGCFNCDDIRFAVYLGLGDLNDLEQNS